MKSLLFLLAGCLVLSTPGLASAAKIVQSNCCEEDPDLVITSIKPTTKSAKVGVPLSFVITVKNIGAEQHLEARESCYIGLYRHARACQPYHVEHDYRAIINGIQFNLGPGRSASYVIPGVSYSKKGKYYPRAKVDAGHDISECNEANNQSVVKSSFKVN